MEQQSYQLSLDMSSLERRKSAAAPENMIRYPSQAKMNQEIRNFWPLKATYMGVMGPKIRNLASTRSPTFFSDFYLMYFRPEVILKYLPL